MRRVVLLGGYGGFGSRIAELLAQGGRFEVLVAGRSLRRAAEFCGSRAGLNLTPVRLDRADAAAGLAALRPWLVVDAAGPFQGAGYGLARACIAAGCHYIDIADGRDFVAGFDTLDAEARRAGVVLISGASSVPALSSAAVLHLAKGLDRVCLVSGAISASNQGTAGRSVLEAILSYAGQPIALHQAERTLPARGWRMLARQTFMVAGTPPVRGRWVALCDVPDLALLSDRHPDRPLVLFRAGGEFALQTLALWLLAWLVQLGWLRSLRPWGNVIGAAQALTARFGSGRSAMAVRITGLGAGLVVEREWTLIAGAGRGPYTPCLAAPLLAERLAQGVLVPGAYPAAGLLPLEAFAPDFQALGFVTGSAERRRQPLYRRLLGDAFDVLPGAVREMHELGGAALAEGQARVVRGTHPLARLAAWVLRFPPAGDAVPVQVRFREDDGAETWERRFGASSFTSHLSAQGTLLVERFGLLRFGFELRARPQGLGMHLRRWWCGPLPMPRWLGPCSVAHETERDGVFHFDVPVSLPLAGLVVAYSGWLRRL